MGRTWEASGRNGGHAVDEFDNGKCTRTVIAGVSVQVAEMVAGGCTSAYDAGRKDTAAGLATLREIVSAWEDTRDSSPDKCGACGANLRDGFGDGMDGHWRSCPRAMADRMRDAFRAWEDGS